MKVVIENMLHKNTLLIAFNYKSKARQEKNITAILQDFPDIDIIFFDNGSGEESNITKSIGLKENVNYQNGMENVFDFFLNSKRHDNVVVFNASVKIDQEIKVFLHYIASIKNIAFVSSAYHGSYVDKVKHTQIKNQVSQKDITFSKSNQTMLACYTKGFCSKLKIHSLGPYNRSLTRGWGWEIEMSLLADSLSLQHGYLNKVSFEWERNYTAKRLNTVKEYHSFAKAEFEQWLDHYTMFEKFLLKMYLNSGPRIRTALSRRLLNKTMDFTNNDG